MRPMDALPFVIAIVILSVSVVAFVAAWRWKRRCNENDAELVKRIHVERNREKAKLAEAVAAGTHLANGMPRCQASPLCQEEAKHCEPAIERDERVIDFFRRAFGGGARFRVVVPMDDQKPLRHCDTHSPLAEQELRAELSEIEHQRQEALRETEARLARVVRIGLRERLAARIAKEEEPKKKLRTKSDNVVSLSSRTGTG